MSYTAVWLDSPMGRRRKGTGVFIFSLPSSVSHWSKLAPWEPHITLLGCVFEPFRWHVRSQIPPPPHLYYGISFKSKSDERSQNLQVVASKTDCTAATTDSDSVHHCQTTGCMAWETCRLRECEAERTICVRYTLVLTYQQTKIRDL